MLIVLWLKAREKEKKTISEVKQKSRNLYFQQQGINVEWFARKKSFFFLLLIWFFDSDMADFFRFHSVNHQTVYLPSLHSFVCSNCFQCRRLLQRLLINQANLRCLCERFRRFSRWLPQTISFLITSCSNFSGFSSPQPTASLDLTSNGIETCASRQNLRAQKKKSSERTTNC